MPCTILIVRIWVSLILKSIRLDDEIKLFMIIYKRHNEKRVKLKKYISVCSFNLIEMLFWIANGDTNEYPTAYGSFAFNKIRFNYITIIFGKQNFFFVKIEYTNVDQSWAPIALLFFFLSFLSFLLSTSKKRNVSCWFFRYERKSSDIFTLINKKTSHCILR